MSDLRTQTRSQQNVLERLRGRLPGFRTYYDREADRALRNFGGAQLETIACAIQDVIKRTLPAKLGAYQELLKMTELLRNEIRDGDPGYSGFFQASKIREWLFGRIPLSYSEPDDSCDGAADERIWDSESALDSLYGQDEAIVAALVELAASVADGDFEPAATQSELRGLQHRLADRRNRILELSRR